MLFSLNCEYQTLSGCMSGNDAHELVGHTRLVSFTDADQVGIHRFGRLQGAWISSPVLHVWFLHHRPIFYCLNPWSDLLQFKAFALYLVFTQLRVWNWLWMSINDAHGLVGHTFALFPSQINAEQIVEYYHRVSQLHFFYLLGFSWFCTRHWWYLWLVWIVYRHLCAAVGITGDHS